MTIRTERILKAILRPEPIPYHELSEDAQDIAIEEYRNKWLCWDYLSNLMSMECDYIKDSWSSPDEMFYQKDNDDLSPETRFLLANKLIESIEINELNYDNRDPSKIELTFVDVDKVLAFFIEHIEDSSNESPFLDYHCLTSHQVKRLLHWYDEGFLVTNDESLELNGEYFLDNPKHYIEKRPKLAAFILELEYAFFKMLKDVKENITSYVEYCMQQHQDYLMSDEGIHEELQNNDFIRFNPDGTFADCE